MRAQASLGALAVALALLTGATVVGVVVADAALADADRDPRERRAAAAVADRLVAADAPTTVRANALDAGAVDDLNANRLAELAPPAARADVRVALDGRPVVTRGDPAAGRTVRRSVVVVSRVGSARTTVDLARPASVRVPPGVGRARVRFDPGPNTTVRTVEANGRVVLHADGGLAETAVVHLSRYEPTTVRVRTGANATGSVSVAYSRRRVVDRTLSVTVDV